MSVEWYLMNASTTGGYENEEFGLWKDSFRNDILTSFAHDEILNYHERMTNTPDRFPGVFQSETENSYNQMKIRQVLCEIGNVRCGDLLKIKDRWWLVVSLVDDNKVYEKAVLYYCNYMLNFTSPLTRKTVTYPAYIHNATQYNSGEKSRDYITVTSSQNIIILPYNDETVRLDNDYRFLVDRNSTYPSAWKIAQMDSTNDFWDGNGVVRMMCVEDEHASTDDDVNMVADNQNWLDRRYPDMMPPDAGGGWID